MEPIYVIQPAFVGGEVSEDVASRVDLEKYQLALLQAENALVRPYGGVKKRPGLIFCGEAKHASKRCTLVKFDFAATVSYVLEMGEGYIRVWRDGRYLGVELASPYSEEEAGRLRFVQSADVLYVTCATQPPMKLLRYEERRWKLVPIEWTVPPFDEINPDEENRIAPSAMTGEITLTAQKDTFAPERKGEWMKVSQRMEGRTVSASSGVTAAIPVGDTWKVITHGTWAGQVWVEVSYDGGATWLQERSYTSNSDFNATESGSVEEYVMMRARLSIRGGSCTVDFSAFPYTHVGYARLTEVVDKRSAKAAVMKRLGGTQATANWHWAAWSRVQGYPTCATFFQDRLCFAGSRRRPQRVWMSRSGDYESFEVQREKGAVTDDSAVTVDLLSLKSYRIMHMTAMTDLLILTEGNEWTISGQETVTPANVTPRNQQNFGTNEVLPIRIGNRVVYVQRRGSIVRDMGYSYETDSYIGADLTLLAKHMIRGHEILSSSFQQEPDSILFFVRDDGALLCLTYIAEQQVYGWSRIVTDGEIEGVLAAPCGNNDMVYVVVRRRIEGTWRRYVERFDLDHMEKSQQAYCMMDAAVVRRYEEPRRRIEGLGHLEGREALAMGDGYLFEPLRVRGGAIELPAAVRRVCVGLPYVMRLEQPNVEMSLKDGTMQGRQKSVPYATLRLVGSFGGQVGPDEEHLADIRYDADETEMGQDMLFTGDLGVTLAQGGFNGQGRVLIRHATPYPFRLAAIIRTVTFGG